MSSINNIVKRNGEKVPFDPDKLNKWAEWASEVGVDWSSVVLEACRKCHDGCTTTDLHNSMIAACVDQETTQHLKMAGRLYIGALIKETFGGLGNIPSLQKMYEKMTGLGLWAPMDYSEDDLAWFNSFIDHSRDFNTSLTELKQITDKYAIVDRVSKIVYETPQFVYMRMAMGNMEKMPKHRRKDDVVKLYQYLSLKKINAPTPFSINLGTPKKQYASCCVTTTNDTAASLAAADHIAYMMTCASAGIGAHIKTRSRGAKVRQGAIMHLGKLPYYKVAQAAVGANLQSCYDEETEVLTSRGFVPFSKLTDSDYVAQVDDNGDVSFVIPLERQVSDYEGVMYHFKTNRNMGIDLLVTPNHRMAWKQVKKVAPESHSKQHHLNNGWNVKNKNTIIQDAFSIAEAENFQPKRETEFVFGGKAIGNNDELCPLVRFKIAFQADGVSKWAGDFAYIFRFTKERKINRFREIVTQCGFEFTESLQKTGVTSFYVKVGEELQKDFSWLDLRFRSAKWFDAFLREVAQWDGSLSVDTSMDCVTFSTTTESVANIVQSAASLCGAYSALSVIEPMKEQHSTQYHMYISFDRTTTTGRTMQKIATQYSGKVYCVTVPTGLIIVRRNGKTAVCGNSRGGAMTMHYNALDPEIMDLLSLKNVQTVEQKRIKDIDYSFGFNEEFARRVAKNETWMLVDYGDAPELYEAMYDPDQSKFVDLYKQIESNPLVKKEFVNARDIALKALKEGVETGRIYLHRTDELNRHTPFKDKIYSSNLCQEIALPTKGYNSVAELYESGESGEIGLCSLGAIVAGNTTHEEWEDVAYYAVLMIDNVIELMDYPFNQLEYTAKARRSIGVGITNLAYDMANRGLKYSSVSGKRYIHKLAEMHSYYLHKASLRLAKERGVCDWTHKTKYPEGWLPIDTANKVIDTLVDQPLLCDWETLRKDIVANGGIRNSVLEAFMPNESSSVATGGTNSIYPIRSLKVIKTSGTNKNLFIAPKAEEMKWDYELAWDIPTKDMLEVYAIIQKFTGQAISADLYITYNSSVGEKSVGAKELLTQFLTFTKLGVKCRYYVNSSTGVNLDEQKCSSGGCTL